MNDVFSPEPEPTEVDAVKFMVNNADFMDHDRLMTQLAASHPTMFANAMKELIPDFDTSMLLTAAAKIHGGAFMRFLERHVAITKGSAQAISLLMNKEKVPAIKQMRMMYGFGLLEAKHLADALQDMMSGTKGNNWSPTIAEYSAFKDSSVSSAFWELVRVWRSMR